MDFNDNWIFYREGDDPLEVTLPHDAMISEKRDAGCPNGVNSGYFPGGKYWLNSNKKSCFCQIRGLLRSGKVHAHGEGENGGGACK